MNYEYFKSLTSLREKVKYILAIVKSCRRLGISDDTDIIRVIKAHCNSDETVLKILSLALNEVR